MKVLKTSSYEHDRVYFGKILTRKIGPECKNVKFVKSKHTSQRNIEATRSTTHEIIAGCWDRFLLMEWGWISTHMWQIQLVSNNQENTTETTGKTVVNLTKCVLLEQEVPDVIISDNGSHYNCKIYKEFSKEWDFQHITSSPRYTQSNGLIERQVQSVKHTPDKAKKSGKKTVTCHCSISV